VQSNRSNLAQVQAQQAAVKQAELDLEFTKIVSPVDGVAGLAHAQVGDLVGPSTGVLTTVSSVDPIKAYFTITEQRYVQVMQKFQSPEALAAHQLELQFQLKLADGSIYPQPGKFFAVDRQVDPRTGSIRVAAEFPNPGNVLRPGQFARVVVRSGVTQGALLVPQRAIFDLQGTQELAVVGPDGKISVRPVTLGPAVGEQQIVTQGVQEGEKVVVEGVQKAREGTLVQPQPWTPPATPAPATAGAH
jgi:membrane fusion protein (multidrug efflux system)